MDMKANHDPGKLYCERCEREIEEGQTMVEDGNGFSHFKCKHPKDYRNMKSWKK